MLFGDAFQELVEVGVLLRIDLRLNVFVLGYDGVDLMYLVGLTSKDVESIHLFIDLVFQVEFSS